MDKITLRPSSLDEWTVRDLFEYNAENGMLIRKDTGNTGSIGDKHGHLIFSINKRNYYVHRLIWMYVYGKWPKYQIDHINRNPADNRLCNLRDVPPCINNYNSNLDKRNVSGKTGVTWYKEKQRWCAQLTVNGKKINLGSFIVKQDAINAREQAEHNYLGAI